MEDKVNNFGITFSTVNGSGSATANNTIHRAIFKMGIPVAGRNIFPSNIQGLPTWYSIRVNADGLLGRLEKDDIVVCLNQEALGRDVDRLNENGLLLLDDAIKYENQKETLHIVRMPIDAILGTCEVPGNLKVYLANMVYVGVLANLIRIDIKAIEEALGQHFNHKEKAIQPNLDVVNAAYDWASKNIKQDCEFVLKGPQEKYDKIIVDGNTAAALGSLYGGLQFAAWYPITPATEIAETINAYIPSLRFDHEKHQTTCVVVQAEDELASIGMVVGAGWAGLRSLTATSGPGLCLMAEFLGLAYFAEVPLVVWDVQRVGPSTGLPTRTSQGDLAFVYSIGHGDSDPIILLPGDVSECFAFGWKALDIAEKYQTPVVVLSDLELGMNNWMSDPFEYPGMEIDRGKVLWEEDIEKMIQQGKEWGRYLDMDGDAIPRRTVPGNLHPKASYFARGTGHDEFAHYSEDPEDWKKNMDRLKMKYRSASAYIPVPVIQHSSQSTKIGVISYGSSDMPVSEATRELEKRGIFCDYMRIRSIPLNEDVESFIREHETLFIVECNRDGQMKDILAVNFTEYAHRHVSISKLDGLSLSAEWIVHQITEHIGRAE